MAASGFPPEALLAAIPPACRRAIEPAPSPRADGSGVVVELPAWTFDRPVRHLVPAFSALADPDYGARFELSACRSGRWSPWVGGASIGRADFEPIGAQTELLTSDIDVFRAPMPIDALRIRLRLRVEDRSALLGAPWFIALSAWDPDPAGSEPAARGGARLAVPALSQMEAAPELRHRVCSPTSVAMVLAYWGVTADVAGLAAEMFHPELDLYGVWPAAVRTAGRRGIAGYLLRFPDWASAAWCLEQGIPIIASVRYEAGELDGAAVAATPGHLLVLTGYEDGVVLVNDPAAPVAGSVARRYRLEELRRVWLERSGVGYVLFRAAGGMCGKMPRV